MLEIKTRPAQDGDRSRCIWIEAGAMGGSIAYIDDVWELFTRGGDGELTLAEQDGAVGGMGKLTHLYGRFCWLEVLRVHPDFQNHGLGKAIYRRYMAQMAELGLTACGMYTGADNTHSRHLAELYGLALAGRFTEYQQAVAPSAAPMPDFQPVAPGEGEALLAPYYPHMGGFASINRTWYPAAPGLGHMLARRGWLYRHPASQTILVAGTRFQPHKSLHIPFVHGDLAAALTFAHALAAQQGSATLSAMRPFDAPMHSEPLMGAGFAPLAGDLITLWKDL